MAYEYRGELVPCPLCRSSSFEEIASRSRNGGSQRTVACRACGLVFTNPLPTTEELDGYYRWSYRRDYKGTEQPRLKHVYRAGRRAVERWRRLLDLGRGSGTLLDIGCGGGEFLYLTEQVGFEACGLEPNVHYGAFAARAYDLDIALVGLEAASYPDGSFDVITANHVLEHLRDPVAALRRIRRWLSADGVLVVEVPNVDAVYHSPSNHFHIAHLFNFSRQTLEQAAGTAGLRPVSTVLVPGVKHLNMALVADGSATVPACSSAHAEDIVARLRAHTALRHLLSPNPYRRLAGNLARPVKERLALGNLDDPRAVLDALYRPVLNGVGASN